MGAKNLTKVDNKIAVRGCRRDGAETREQRYATGMKVSYLAQPMQMHDVHKVNIADCPVSA